MYLLRILKKKIFIVENSYHNLSSDSCLHDLLSNYPLSNLKFDRHNGARFIIVSTFVMFRRRFFSCCVIFLVRIYLFPKLYFFVRYIIYYIIIIINTYLLS